ERLGESSGGDQSAMHSNALKEHKKNEGMIELVILDGAEVVAAPIGDDTADLVPGEDSIPGDYYVIERQRLQELQRRGDLVGIRCHRQLSDHPLQGCAVASKHTSPANPVRSLITPPPGGAMSRSRRRPRRVRCSGCCTAG